MKGANDAKLKLARNDTSLWLILLDLDACLTSICKEGVQPFITSTITLLNICTYKFRVRERNRKIKEIIETLCNRRYASKVNQL